jgi:hypothetical protein
MFVEPPQLVAAMLAAQFIEPAARKLVTTFGNT